LKTDRAVFDTSVYIAALRRPIDLPSITAGRQLWMNAVVLEELYAGAGGRDVRTLEFLERSFLHTKRMVVPSLHDWRSTGLLLAKLARRFGYEQIGRGRLTNDALIAVSSARCGATLVTLNESDFSRLAEFHDFRWEIAKL
jgi:predicted nucleic acid-binding protein